MPHRPLAALLVLALPTCPVPAQTIARTSAAALGKPLTLEYRSTPGHAYVMFLAAPPTAPTPVPGVGGTLFLNPLRFFYLYASAVPASGIDPFALGVPADPGLLGAVLDFQNLDISPALSLSFSSNFAELLLGNGIGTITMLEGPSAIATTGTLQVRAITNATAGAPVTQSLPAGATQVVYHHGWNGYVEWMPANQGNSSSELTEAGLDTFRRVVRDARDDQMQRMQLPNGFDLFVMRDATNRSQFFLASLERATGIVRELSGSRITDQGTTVNPASNYRPQFAFTLDGSVAAAIQHDSSSTPTPNVGPPDRVVLVKTDFRQTWTNGLQVIDVSPIAAPAMHTCYNGTLRFGNGVVFAEAEEPSGATGAAVLYGGPDDGSARMALIPMPNTGTNQPFYWSRSDWRMTDDGRTMAFVYAAYANNVSNAESDIAAVRNIARGAPLLAVNITAFPTATAIPNFGISALGGTGNASNGAPSLRGALSPDGTRVAFTTGLHTAASPAQICIAPTDGSRAGSIAPITQGQFDPQVVQFHELNWLDNDRLLFLAGGPQNATTAPPTGQDYYLHDRLTGTITNLTRTTTGLRAPPFTQGGDTGNLVVRASFWSHNRAFYYFARTDPWAAPAVGLYTDLKGINVATRQLFDVTGSEFSGGTAPSIRPANSWSPYDWLPRRNVATSELYFVAGRNTGSASSFGDDEVFRFDPETGSQAVQVTANNGVGATVELVQRIRDLRFSPDGVWMAYAEGVGTGATVPEDLLVSLYDGTLRTRVSGPTPAGAQGIRRGSVHFTSLGPQGIVWSQGTNSRTTPTVNSVALWNSVSGLGAPLRLSDAPQATAKQQQLIGWSPLNP